MSESYAMGNGTLQVLILWTEKSMHLVSGHLLMTVLYSLLRWRKEKNQRAEFSLIWHMNLGTFSFTLGARAST